MSSPQKSREVSKTEDAKSQTGQHTRPDQPIEALLKDVSQAGETISKDNGLLDLPLYLALLDGSLSFCEQPRSWLEKVDDTRWRGGWDVIQSRLMTDG
jgi:hypothetical protein